MRIESCAHARHLAIVGVVVATSLVLGSSAFATGGQGEREELGACSATTQLGYSACKNDVVDEWWTALAICKNESDVQERWECMSLAREEYVDARGDCREAREARIEVCDALGELEAELASDDTALLVDCGADPRCALRPSP